MVYRVIGTMSGSSLDGLDVAFVEFQETAGKWTYELRNCTCYPYDDQWKARLSNASELNAMKYNLLHAEYGHYVGQLINTFIETHSIHYQVQLIASHGHTTFHMPDAKMTAQLGCGASIAAETGINVVSDLRSMDVALGGQGAPIVPIGEKLLLDDYPFFLNIGGIANISLNLPDRYIAFDVCPANRVMNMLAAKKGKEYDSEGQLAASGKVDVNLLRILNDLEYYGLGYPKSLSNDFGTDVVYPIAIQSGAAVNDAMRTYVEHICMQVAAGAMRLKSDFSIGDVQQKMLVTGGGAKNTFLINRLTEVLAESGVEVHVPSPELVDYKEAIIMALIGVLRWREENNTLASVTGARRNSIGGTVWMGLEA